MIKVEASKANMQELIEALKRGELVFVCENGKPVAQLLSNGPNFGPVDIKQPLNPARESMVKDDDSWKNNPLFQPHPELADLKIVGDITGPLTEEEWPEEFR